MSGLKLAVLYGFYPHILGFCGPQEKTLPLKLWQFLISGSIAETEVRKILKDFKAAYAYYRLIAKANRIRDPFHAEVVEAYWLGNELLEKVSLEAVKEMIANDFAGPGLLGKEAARLTAEKIPVGAKPHHSFHVYFIGSITGRIELDDKLRDLCRISWGKVIEKSKIKYQTSKIQRKNQKYLKNLDKPEKIIIEYQPIIKRERKYILGRKEKREIIWDKRLVPELKAGDWVTTHWGHAIQVISRQQAESLEKYTRKTINLINGQS